MLIDADHGHPVEPARVLDQHPLALGKDRAVRGMPGHAQAFRDTGDGEVLAHNALQRPAQPATGDLRPGLRGLGHVLPPHATAPGALVAADPHQQRRRPPAQRFVRERPRDRAAGDALRTTRTAPVIRINGTAFQHRPARGEKLPRSFEPKLIEPAERSQVRRQEGSVGHGEVFRMGSVGTSIIGRPRPLPGHRRAHRGCQSFCPRNKNPVPNPELCPSATSECDGCWCPSDWLRDVNLATAGGPVLQSLSQWGGGG
jgi:hypothetical protein